MWSADTILIGVQFGESVKVGSLGETSGCSTVNFSLFTGQFANHKVHFPSNPATKLTPDVESLLHVPISNTSTGHFGEIVELCRLCQDFRLNRSINRTDETPHPLLADVATLRAGPDFLGQRLCDLERVLWRFRSRTGPPSSGYRWKLAR